MLLKWNQLPIPSDDLISSLSLELNINRSLSTILIQRGIKDFETAKTFFRPQLSQLHDPFLMKDMDIAVNRINKAIEANEKILIYGDYDVDGTTAIALFYGFLITKYSNISYYVPDRHTEGYGVSYQAIEWANDNGFKLIISLDCGIKDGKKIALSNSFGIDFIVCDHHLPGEELPPALAVLNPKRKDCSYPFKELSGCGVGFKLIQAFCQQNSIDQQELYPFLDLLVVSIVADIVPILDENRVLAHYGLIQLNADPRPGLKALINIANLKPEIQINNIVFGIAPRINAAGRIGHAKHAVELLLAPDEATANKLVVDINLTNIIRRDFDETTTFEALQMIENDDFLSKSKSTVLYKNDWNKGVVGIVASRCIEKYYRPTIILTESNNKATGSARSVHGFDVYEAISACSEYLDQFGGHMYAAGLTLPIENVDAFRIKFEEVVCRNIREEHLNPAIEIDVPISLSTLTDKFYNILKQISPFGPGNKQPVFTTSAVEITSGPFIFKNEHLKFFVKKENSAIFEVVGFGLAGLSQQLKENKRIDICYTVSENNYNGAKTIQLLLKDVNFDR